MLKSAVDGKEKYLERSKSKYFWSKLKIKPDIKIRMRTMYIFIADYIKAPLIVKLML